MRDRHTGAGRVYGLDLSRAEAVAAAQAAGYTFAPLATGAGRPHLVGWSADGQCRVELIGPEARTFKATLVADPADDMVTATAWFLTAFAPDWRDGPAWLTAHLPEVVRDGEAEAYLPRLHVRLRRMGHRPSLIFTLSWVSDGSAEVAGADNGLREAVPARRGRQDAGRP